MDVLPRIVRNKSLSQEAAAGSLRRSAAGPEVGANGTAFAVAWPVLVARSLSLRTRAAPAITSALLAILTRVGLERLAAGPHPLGRDLKFVQWKRCWIF